MIRSNRATPIGRRLAIASAAAVTLAVAACSDAATAPQTTTARDVAGPSAVILKVSARVKARIVDTANVTLKENGWVEFTSSNSDTVRIMDNSAKDLDPAVGVMEVQMAKAASYKACFSMSQHYRGDYTAGTPFPRCSATSSSAAQVDLGKVFARQSPQIVFLIKNQFGTLIGGAAVTV